VQATIALVENYPRELVSFHKGMIEDTPLDELPQSIAILRLDTDFYSSTRWELQHMYPLVEAGGVVIVDDYGSWQGSAKATDEFLAAHPEVELLQIADEEPGRYFIKPGLIV
jgi:O-methyltransferase